MSEPKITVTMPAYNAAAFVGEAIKSVLSQSYKNFELLVIDDGSTDDTLKIIKSFSSHPRLRWFAQMHQGLVPTRNRLLKLAKGAYISICDADDIILPDKIKSHVYVLDNNPDIAVVYGNVLVMDKYSRIISDSFIQAKDLNNWWDLLENAVVHCGATFRKKAAMTIGGYNAGTALAEDYDLWLKLAEKYQFHYQSEPCAIYRSYPESTSRQDKAMADSVIRIKKNAILRRYGKHLIKKFTW